MFVFAHHDHSALVKHTQREKEEKIIKNTKFYEQNMLIFSQPFHAHHHHHQHHQQNMKINTNKKNARTQ